MSKWGTFGHVLEGIGRAVDPRIGTAIDAGKAIHNTKGSDRISAILTEIDTDLELAGDASGKAALSDPALRVLFRKYVEDGVALHAYIEAHKHQPEAAGPTQAPSTGE